MTMLDEPVYTIAEVAQRLRVHTNTVHNWLRAGKLAGYRPGGPRGGWRITASDIERLMNAGRQEAKGQEPMN
jgi:excisionase family DNA binding protein